MTVKAIMKTTITALVLGTLMISNSYGFERNLYERLVQDAVEIIVIQKFNGGYYGRGGIAIDNVFGSNGDFNPSGRWIVRDRGSNCPRLRSYGRPDCF